MRDERFARVALRAAPEAVCLDGSRATYYIRSGHGSGAQKWYVHYEGGGWCTDFVTCWKRTNNSLGSSKDDPAHMMPYENRNYFNISRMYFSARQAENPLMWNWNSVFVRYCDGTAFTGRRLTPHVLDIRNRTEHQLVHLLHQHVHAAGFDNYLLLHFRGSDVQDAVVEDLFARRGLQNATDVVLAGTSAGGLAVHLFADRWRRRLTTARVVAVPDSGFFLRYPEMEKQMRDMLAIGNGTAQLNPECTSALLARGGNESDCIFPEVALNHTRTPTFVVQSQYDLWQLSNLLFPKYGNIKSDIALTRIKLAVNGTNGTNASALVERFGLTFRTRLFASLASHRGHGAFVDSCAHHAFAFSSLRVDGVVAATAFRRWYESAGVGALPNSTQGALVSAGPQVWLHESSFPCDSCCLETLERRQAEYDQLSQAQSKLEKRIEDTTKWLRAQPRAISHLLTRAATKPLDDTKAELDRVRVQVAARAKDLRQDSDGEVIPPPLPPPPSPPPPASPPRGPRSAHVRRKSRLTAGAGQVLESIG